MIGLRRLASGNATRLFLDWPLAMISLVEALRHIAENIRPTAVVEIPLADACGRVLGRDARSDVDSPAYDKSLVDGFAVVAQGQAAGTLRVSEEITAGQLPRHVVDAGSAARIMTGAPLPPGADAVVMKEDVEDRGQSVRIGSASIAPGQNILRRATSFSAGQTVVPAGRMIRPLEVGILAEAGVTQVPVHGAADVSIIATGNELVAADTAPGPGQLRNSNGPMLTCAVRAVSAVARDRGIVGDSISELHEAVASGLESDFLLLSGGVSVGVLDLVPRVLDDLGVQQVFHGVRIKPGKPVWFGRHDTAEHRACVFGLPGNPVSSFVGFQLLVRAALARFHGHRDWQPTTISARLAGPLDHHARRDAYYPARLHEMTDGRAAEPVPWQGSADLAALTRADALIHVPPGDATLAEGQSVEVLRI